MMRALGLAALLIATSAHAGGVMLPNSVSYGSAATYNGPVKGAQGICTATNSAFACPFSGSPAQNDLLVAACALEAVGAVPAANTGWTLDHGTANGQLSAGFYWKIAGASEPATQTPCTSGSGSGYSVAIVDLTGFSSTVFSAHFARGSTTAGFNGPLTNTFSVAGSFLVVAFSDCASNSTVNTVLTINGLNAGDFTAVAGNIVGGSGGVGIATGTIVDSGANVTSTYNNTCDEQLDVNFFHN